VTGQARFADRPKRTREEGPKKMCAKRRAKFERYFVDIFGGKMVILVGKQWLFAPKSMQIAGFPRSIRWH
jgi:hypothetical protein